MAGKCHIKLGKKLRLNPIVSIRVNFGSIRASVTTPVKVFIFFHNYSMDSVVKGLIVSGNPTLFRFSQHKFYNRCKICMHMYAAAGCMVFIAIHTT